MKTLKKELRLIDLYAISTGATLSAGFFLLPGLAAEQCGPALVLAYLIAALPMIPAMFSIVELATAMPRAGGVYYFLDRSLGPAIGTIGGLGTWLALMLKVAFALIGMGAYIALFFDLPIRLVAICLAVALGILNLFGAKKSGGLQVLLVAVLLTLLTGFVGSGLVHLNPIHFENFLGAGFNSIMATSGLVYISYVGVTKIASLSEEVADPEHSLPRAVFLSLGTAIVIYVLGTIVMVGVVPQEELAGDLTPVATAAGKIFGEWGKRILAVAALVAFTSVANAGTLSASRYPLAMSRDGILPQRFARIGRGGSPIYGVLATMVLIVVILIFFDVTKIAKLASAFQLLMFAFVCLAVIVMRESRIESYDPGSPSPFYPWMQIFGIVAPIWLIGEMGPLALAFSLALVVASATWYRLYAKKRTDREGAIYHLFERLGQRRDEGLDRELRGILKEKGLREHDPFEEVVSRCFVVDGAEGASFEELVTKVSGLLAERVPATADQLTEQFLQGTRIGATPVTHGVALPHLRLDAMEDAELAIVRSRAGVKIPLDHDNIPIGHQEGEQRVHAIFFLISPEGDPAQHLRILAQLAGRVDEDSFTPEWQAAPNEQKLREVLLRDEHFLSLRLRPDTPAAALIGQSLRNVHLPEGALVNLIRRRGKMIVPSGGTVLEEGDRVTIIGTPERILELSRKYETLS